MTAKYQSAQLNFFTISFKLCKFDNFIIGKNEKRLASLYKNFDAKKNKKIHKRADFFTLKWF